MKKEHKMTIEELTIIINKGFENTTNQLRKEIKESSDKMENRMDKMENRMDKMENRMEKMETNVGIMSKEIDKLQRGQERIEDRLDEMAADNKVLKDHEKRIGILEKKVALAN